MGYVVVAIIMDCDTLGGGLIHDHDFRILIILFIANMITFNPSR